MHEYHPREQYYSQACEIMRHMLLEVQHCDFHTSVKDLEVEMIETHLDQPHRIIYAQLFQHVKL